MEGVLNPWDLLQERTSGSKDDLRANNYEINMWFLTQKKYKNRRSDLEE